MTNTREFAPTPIDYLLEMIMKRGLSTTHHISLKQDGKNYTLSIIRKKHEVKLAYTVNTD
jgi:hypothetical protein